MPCNYKDYPSNWKTEIRPQILARAGEVRDDAGKITVEAVCELCGVQNHAVGYRGNDGKFYEWNFIENQLEKHGVDMFNGILSQCINKKTQQVKKPTTIVLTVAHLDHDKENADVDYSRLQALCQKCHLQMDMGKHIENRKTNLKKKKGIIELF